MDKKLEDGLIGETINQYKIQELVKETNKSLVFRALDLNYFLKNIWYITSTNILKRVIKPII